MLTKSTSDEQVCRIALSMIDGIGPKTARSLLSHYGSARDILAAPLRELHRVPGMGAVRARACKDKALLGCAEAELDYVLANGIRQFFIGDDDYPARLKSCGDAPVLLNFRGNSPVESRHMVAVVGTRRNSDYGHQLTEALVSGLKDLPGITIVSGLAQGIDAIAHRCCLAAGIPTIGVLAHGLDRMYPPGHRELARQMEDCGGLLTEFPAGTRPDKTNFPVRNRVVAGLCDVTVVVESNDRGGAMITAYMAASYNREVAAFPGRVADGKSAGPLKLIRTNIASLICSADDLIEVMGWARKAPSEAVQPRLFLDLSGPEQRLVDVLQDQEAAHSDELLGKTGFQPSELSAALLQLEMQGLVRSLPGKRYRLR